MPSSVTRSTSGCNPSGQTSGSTCQSPRPASSLRRPTNQPSSSTYRSAPTSAPYSARAISLSRFMSKYTDSQVLRMTGLGVLGWVDRPRRNAWNRPATSSSPVP